LSHNASECCRIAFSKKRIRDAWRTSFGVPFTRAALNDKKVRHEIVLNEDGETMKISTLQSKYLEVRILNNTCCDILNVARL
jgi:hypothetical protein